MGNDTSKRASAGGCDEHGKQSAKKSDAYKRKRECEQPHARHQHHHERLRTPILHKNESVHANLEREVVLNNCTLAPKGSQQHKRLIA